MTKITPVSLNSDIQDEAHEARSLNSDDQNNTYEARILNSNDQKDEDSLNPEYQ